MGCTEWPTWRGRPDGEHRAADCPPLPPRGRDQAARTRTRALNKRIHILEGFEKVFDALDEIIRMIRKSEGKADAAQAS
jgi:hypothetical protein